MYKITIKDSGFVTGDFLRPIAYAGESNSRVLNVVHPTFDNCHYQIIVLKESRPYSLGLVNGETILPPSLTDVAGKLQCQFVAIRKPNEYEQDNSCDCFSDSTSNCTEFIFKSDTFTLEVAQGLNLNGLTPIPPYEKLTEMYNNLSKAELAVEKSKADNMLIVDAIDEKIRILQSHTNANAVEAERAARTLKDKELEAEINELINLPNIKTNDLIKAFNGNVIVQSEYTLILTNNATINDVTLPAEYTLVIPKDKTLTVNGSFKIEGVLKNNGTINVVKSIECSGLIETSSLKSLVLLSGSILFTSLGNLYIVDPLNTKGTTLIGHNAISCTLESLIYIKNIDGNIVIEINGEGIINDEIDILEFNIIVNGLLKVNSIAHIYENYYIKVNDNSKLLVNDEIDCKDIKTQINIDSNNAILEISETGIVADAGNDIQTGVYDKDNLLEILT